MSTETTTRANTCGNCTYWNAVEGKKGECRRQPPQAISFKVDDSVQFQTLFPATEESDWCGEFSAK